MLVVLKQSAQQGVHYWAAQKILAMEVKWISNLFCPQESDQLKFKTQGNAFFNPDS
jgi:hypothetical protein